MSELEYWQSPDISELAKALVKAQAALRPAKREAVNPFYKSRYADLATCWEAVSCFGENGIAIVQCPMPCDEKTIALETMLIHTSGQWLRSRTLMPLAKMDPQGAGSAITYARRYALGCMTGLVTDEDDDGNAAVTPQSHTTQHNAAPIRVTSDVLPDGIVIWSAGSNPPKGHRGLPINEVPTQYLQWYEKNGPQDEYREHAANELNRRALEGQSL